MSYAQQHRNPTKHLVGLSVVVVIHLVLGWALVNGLARRVVEVIRQPLETKIIEEVKPPPPPPDNLPPPPKIAPPPSFVPPPEVVVAAPAQTAPTISVTRDAPPPAPPAAPAPAAPPAPPKVAAKPAIANVSACAPKSEDYPPAAQRAETTGTTRIRFTIDGGGKLVKSEIVKSAGPSREHKMLDKVAETKLGGCTFTAGIDDTGHPVGGTFEVEYLWKLQ